METVLSTVIAGLFSLVLAVVNFRQSVRLKALEKERKSLTSENVKLKNELSSLSLLFDVELFHIIKEQVFAMFEETKADRFLIMFAVNGKREFNYVSVAYEQTRTYQNKGAISRYVRLNIDEHYQHLLKDVERSGSVTLEVQDMPDCLLKALYESEKPAVKHSIIKFLTRIAIDEENDLVVYTSMATFSDEPYTVHEKAVMRSLHDKIRKYANEIEINLRN